MRPDIGAADAAGGGLVSIVVPVYNEAGNIGACLAGLRDALEGLPHEILVCYDFDEDTTLAAIRAMDGRPPTVRLVKNELGRGAAYAIQAGFRAAKGDVVVTTMADLSDPPEVIPAMAAKIRSGASVVSGSRYMKGGSQQGGPFLKRTFSRIAGLSLYHFGGVGTHDATTNFRAYSKRYLDGVKVESRHGFELALELTVKAHLAGLVVDEVPSAWLDRSAGASRFRMWRWMPRYLAWYWMAMRRPIAWLGVFAGALAWTMLLFVPWNPGIEPEWLDPSWVMGIGEALVKGMRFGHDIVFTMGPWGFVYGRSYRPETFKCLLVIWTALTACMGRLLWAIARRTMASATAGLAWAAGVVFLAWVAPGYFNADAFMFVFTAAVLAYYWTGKAGKTVVIEAAALAAMSVVKFTFGAIAAAAIATVAAEEILRRRWTGAARTTLVFAGAALALWKAAGQRFGDVWSYVRGSYLITAGYNGAMARETISGAACVAEPATYVVGAALALAALALWTRGRAPRGVAVVRAAGMAAILFIVFKLSFVRHDKHGVTAPFTAAAIALVLAPAMWGGLRRGGKAVLCAAIAVGFFAAAQAVALRQNYMPEHMRGASGRIASNFAAARRLATDGERGLSKSYRGARKTTMSENPLPWVEGSVDIYPYNQGVVIAYGMKYAPRPVFQSYSAYLPELAELNAAHLRGMEAPGTLFFNVATIDERFPAMDDGLSWPEILTRYDLQAKEGKFLVFKRAEAARSFSLVEKTRLEAAFGEWVELPEEARGGPVWAKVAVRPTGFNRVAAIFYKVPWVNMTVRTKSGEEKTYRLVTAIAANGFLLSPVVEDAAAFARLATKDWDALGEAGVEAVRFSVNDGDAMRYYEAQIGMELFGLDYPAQAQ